MFAAYVSLFIFTPFMFTLFMFTPPSFKTRQKVGGKIGQLEVEKLNLQDQMVCVKDLQEDRAGKTKMWKGNSRTWKRKEANWQKKPP